MSTADPGVTRKQAQDICVRESLIEGGKAAAWAGGISGACPGWVPWRPSKRSLELEAEFGCQHYFWVHGAEALLRGRCSQRNACSESM